MEKYSQDQEKELKKIRSEMIADILSGRHDTENLRKLANYDADFRTKEEPIFINIWSTKKGYNLGYIVFHDFLIKIGQNKTFSSTDFEPAGIKMFKKAQEAGLIKQISKPEGVSNITRWEIIGDPKKNLEKLQKEFDN
jgi:hypothetical protein